MNTDFISEIEEERQVSAQNQCKSRNTCCNISGASGLCKIRKFALAMLLMLSTEVSPVITTAGIR
ncbi:hypothetical protein D3C81_2161580 [compost metagenome]